MVPPLRTVVDAGVAQLVEQLIRNQQVAGSSPATSSIQKKVWYVVIKPFLHMGADFLSKVKVEAEYVFYVSTYGTTPDVFSAMAKKFQPWCAQRINVLCVWSTA